MQFLGLHVDGLYANLRNGRTDFLCHTEERGGALLIPSRVIGRTECVPKEKAELVTFLKIENLCRSDTL